MVEERIRYKNGRLMTSMFLPLILIITNMELFFHMTNEYIFLNRVLCLCISGLIFIMCVVKVKNRDLGILKYLGVGCFFIGLIRFWDVEISHININAKVNTMSIEIIIYLEIFNIISSIILYYKNAKVYIQWLILFFTTITLYLIFNIKSQGFKLLGLIVLSKSGLIINQIIMVGLFIFILFLFNKLKIEKKYKWIIWVSFWILISNIFLFISIILNKNLSSFIWISKLGAYFIFYNKVEEELLNNAYSSAYESLNRTKEIKRKLNKNLIKREKELKELNLLLERSEKKYFDFIKAFSNGILLFENNKLIYSNYSKEAYNKIQDEFKFNKENVELNEILEIITGKKFNEKVKIDEFSTEIKIKDSFEKEVCLEIFLIKIYKNRKILVFNDISKIVNQREEIIKIEKKIEEENIKEEFYLNISHELRTPINVVYSALQLNDIYLENSQIKKINKNNNVIRQNCLRLIRTINNFIDSNKLSEGYLEMNCRVYNIIELIENIVTACNFYMKLKNTKLTYDPEYEEIYLLCDKSHIERIMLNILSNSLKYGKDNGNIYVTTKIYNNESIVIEVINDAEAIPEDKRKYIFDKFTRINNALNRPSEGSGLGLYLTKGLVELHKGDISIDAGKSFGNIFKIILPYNKEFKNIEAIENNDVEINNLNQKIDIEFSDIYF